MNHNSFLNYNEITKLDNLEEYSYSYMTEGSVDINKYGSEFGKRIEKIAMEQERSRELLQSQSRGFDFSR